MFPPLPPIPRHGPDVFADLREKQHRQMGQVFVFQTIVIALSIVGLVAVAIISANK